MLTRISLVLFFLVMSLVCINPSVGGAEKESPLTSGQIIYVPAYSDVYMQGESRRLQMTVTLSIRNIDPNHELEINKVEYYSTPGTLLKNFIEKPISLKPLDTVSYVVPQRDTSGGSGANFIVSWRSEIPINPPIVESIMTGIWGSQAIGFVERGVEIFPTN